MGKAATTRERILLAAEEVVLRDGVAKLTLEATAACAGLSKGGVLYHFGSRDLLVTAMVERLVASFHDELDEATHGETGPGTLARSYVRASFSTGGPDADRQRGLGAALLAAMAAQPALLEPLRQDFDFLQAQLDADGIDPVEAAIARLASDGIWLAELFGFADLSPAARAHVRDRLLSRLGVPQ